MLNEMLHIHYNETQNGINKMNMTAKIFKTSYDAETASAEKMIDLGIVKCAADVILALNKTEYKMSGATMQNLIKYGKGNFTTFNAAGDLFTLIIK